MVMIWILWSLYPYNGNDMDIMGSNMHTSILKISIKISKDLGMSEKA